MKKIYSIVFLLLFQLYFFFHLFAGDGQRKIETPKGEALSTSRGFYWNGNNEYVRIVATTKDVWLHYIYQPGKSSLLYRVKKDLTITNVTEKLSTYTQKGRTVSAILITHSDNSIYIINENGDDEEIDASALTALFTTTGEAVKDIAGDDMYAITSNNCFISKDSAHKWQFDTIGIKGRFLNNLSFDSAQRVYLATNGGLYTQELGSAQWIHNVNLIGSNCSYVYVDRFQKVWAKTNTGFFVSKNRGLSFNNAPANITGSITSMADDIYGNIYVLSGSVIYKSLGGTQAFTATDAGILSQISEPVDFQTFRKISADSFLFVASKFGFFTSYNQGNTYVFDGVPSAINYGITKTNAGRLLISNNAGIFSKEAGQPQWTQRFPASGLQTAGKIFKDNNGNLYTTSNSNKLIWKSTNSGLNWNLDTVSYSNVKGNTYSFYIDPAGNQHAYVLASPPMVYVKNTGGIWQNDNAGFTAANFSTATAWGTDNNGYLYLATASVYLQKRPITGGTWVTDTAGLLNNATIYDLAVESNGTLWAGTYIGAFKKSGTKWQQLNYPPGTKTGLTNSCFVVSIDGAGAVWTQWSYFNTLGHAIGSGIYFTQDGGNKWTTMDLDTITVRQLYSFGDTTYAVSYSDGLYQFARDWGSELEKQPSKDKANIVFYPNPSTDEINILINSSSNLPYRLTAYNEFGQIVYSNSYTSNSIRLNTSSFKNGVYIISIPALNYNGKFVVTR